MGGLRERESRTLKVGGITYTGHFFQVSFLANHLALPGLGQYLVYLRVLP